jgi:hypothetical protein
LVIARGALVHDRRAEGLDVLAIERISPLARPIAVRDRSAVTSTKRK